MLDVEASIERVRPAHATRHDPVRRARSAARQSTTSTSTRRPCLTEAARTTVRSAFTVRPLRPITLPTSSSATCNSSTTVPSSSSKDSTATASGLSTRPFARYSSSSFTALRRRCRFPSRASACARCWSAGRRAPASGSGAPRRARSQTAPSGRCSARSGSSSRQRGSTSLVRPSLSSPLGLGDMRRPVAPLVARRASTLAAAGHLRQGRHLALAQLPHHLLHLAELLHELIHGLHVRAGPERDPPPPRAVQDRRVASLLGRHGRDDGLEAVEVAVVDLQVAELAADARHHLQEARQRAHLADLVHLIEEVVKCELLLADLPFELRRLALVHLALGLLDERQDVAHPEDPLRHPIGVEALERVELLAGRGVQDRLAGDRLDGQCGTAARVPVELREDHAVEVRDLCEALRY